MNDLERLTSKILEFRDQRDWKQFHTQKNVAAALSVEAAELLEHFLWDDKPTKPDEVRQEIADILYYTLLFAHEAGIDPADALEEKIQMNASKYPVEKSKGKSTKYTDL